MTNSPNSDNETEQNLNRRVWLLWLSRAGLGFGIVVLIGVLAGAWWAWVFINRELAPLVEKNVSDLLQRPVKLGKLENFTLNSLRFGPSSVPPTATDTDRASAQAVDVSFNPLQLLLTRTLNLDITLVNPDVFIEQTPDGRWISTQIKQSEAKGAITTNVDSIRVSNANVVLLPQAKLTNPRVPVNINPISATVDFLDKGQRFRFNAEGQIAQKTNNQSSQTNPATFRTNGEFLLPSQQLNAQVQAQYIPVQEIDRLIQIPNANLIAGQVNGNLTVKYNPQEKPFVLGVASLQNVSVTSPQLPAPIINTNGVVNFTGRGLNLNNFSTSLGQIPVQLGGSADLDKGLNLDVIVPNVNVANLTQTFKVKPPVPVIGEIKLATKVTGTIESPTILGRVNTTKQTQVDKLNFRDISTNFAFAPQTGELVISNIQISPMAGGKITGKGNAKLGQPGAVALDLQAQNLPGDAIAKIYNVNLPANINIGNVNAQTQVSGPLNNIRIATNFQAPQATYPLTGQVTVNNGEIRLNNAIAQVPGGDVQASARIANRSWQATVQAAQLPVNSILAITQSTNQNQQQKPPEIPPSIRQGRISGTVNLAGNLDSFQLGNIQATAQANLQVAGGNIRVSQAQLNQGKWQGLVNASGINLALFPQVPPQFRSNFNGQFRVAGNLNAPTTNIQATGQGNINIAGGNAQILQAALNDGNWNATVRANRINLGQLAQVPRELQAPFNGEFRLSGNLNATDTNNIKAVGSGNIQVAGGNVNLRSLELNQGNFLATIAASGVQLTRLPQVPKELPVGAFSGQFQVAGNLNDLTAQKDRSPLNQIQVSGQGNVQLAGGNVQLRQFQLNQGNFQTLVDANNVQVARFPQVPNNFQGTFNGQLQARGNLANLTAQNAQSPLNQIQATARGTLQTPTGNLQLQQVELNQGNFQARVTANNLQLSQFNQVPKGFQGIFSGELQARGNLDNLTAKNAQSPLNQIEANATGNLRIGAGNLQIQQLRLNQGNFLARVNTNNFQLAALPQVPQGFRGAFTGQLEAEGNLDSLTNTKSNQSPLAEIQANAQGVLTIPNGGTVQLRQATLNQGNWQVALDANRLQLASLPQVPPQFQGIFTGELQASGNVASLTQKTDTPLSGIEAIGRGRLQIAGGVVDIKEAQVTQGRWAAAVNLAQVQLNQFSQQLKGGVSGDLRVGGSLAALTQPKGSPLTDIQAIGDLNFTQTPYLNRPLSVAFQWNGQQLEIKQATAPGLNASGTVTASFDRNNTPQIANLNLNVQAEDFNLQTLPVALPKNVAIAGLVDFNGQISGQLNALNINGQVGLQNLVVGEFKFDPDLRGNITATAGRGINLQLQGQQDQIAVQLDPNYKPESLLFRRGDILAQGRRQGDLFLLDLANVPVATVKNLAQNFVNLPPDIATQQVSGNLSGNLAINFDTLSVEGRNVAIAQPRIGDLQADSLIADFRYANGTLEIINSRLQQGESIYALSGRATQLLTQTPQVQGKVTVEKGKIQNILAAVDWFNLQGFGNRGGNIGSAANVPTIPVGIPNAPLRTQLQRFAEIISLQQQELAEKQRANTLPDITELQGNFSGTVDFAGTLPRDIQASFNLQGDNWLLGNYKVEQVLAQGTYNQGNLNVQSLKLASQNRSVAFTGTLGMDKQDGVLQIQNFPLEPVNNILQLPVYVTGNLDGTVNIRGDLNNPYASGQLTVKNGTVDGTKIESALATFSYQDARLNLDSQVLINPPQPIVIAGSVPLKLPFAKVSPASNEISLSVNVQNEGLALISLLTNQQVRWVNGTGQAQLTVGGTLERPVPKGFVNLQNATLGGQLLAEDLNNVKGVIQFEGDRITVENLTGNFKQGQVIAQGTIPIFTPLDSQDPARQNPLNITLDQARINLRGLYGGLVDGRVTIVGSAVNPQIGGQVNLLDGQLSLPQTPATVATVSQTAPPSQTLVIEFDNFQIGLSDRVDITLQPILAFRGSGTLKLDGSLDKPRPEGQIALRRGSVNLFAARFRLERGYENVAVFVPERGFNPFLNVRLITNVSEVTSFRLPAPAFSSEVSDIPATGMGSLQSVRVRATVNGWASQLGVNPESNTATSQIIELTSDPPRTESEIVALIGGSFINNLGQGGGGVAGLAGLASSVILPGLEGFFGDLGERLGLSEFRIYPTAITSGKENSDSVLGLAAEFGVDITNNLSVSVLQILTESQPTQFGLRYRFNPEFTLRGSTDFSGDTRAVLEFQKRF
ncbi:translocation/assembly module TamB domain-containing protein [Phormidium sp. LEGE 05292]|uniref:translocation/assembly module TamB domain-containing protein n=1 Tax=[Phormidium] sp. LEGE 05292 TaxID=767427 RepID=UPI0018818956|nr:translocation/assembly module TamB domain-containing protein [Phormidium sp. LEGE 05292]MBE9225007.1 translocation/assembly module TamB domain-containing protein [Phormidium sp. LEGE 05292]